MWDVWEIGCWGCGMLGCELFVIWDVRDVECSLYVMSGV